MIIIIMAWRNIWRNKIRSMIIVGSVVVGLIAGLFVLSLYKGILEDRVRTVIDTEVSHLQIHHPDFKEDHDTKFFLEDPDAILDELKKFPAVEDVALRTVCSGMLLTGTGSTGLQIIGVDPSKEDKVSKLSNKIIDGKTFSEDKKGQIAIGKKLADKMHLRVGKKVVLTFTDPESNIVSAAFRVSAIYKTDNAPRDEQFVYVQRHELNKLFSVSNAAHEAAIILSSDDDVDNMKAEIEHRLPKLDVEAWTELSPETKLMIDTTDSYSHIFIMIIMLALSFGIINTMLMAVLERSKEIGMLLAVGMNRLRLFGMILSETIFLTTIGTPLGILFTWLIVQKYHRQGIDISSMGGVTMSEFGFSSIIYPAFPWERMPGELIIVISVAIVSSLIPAVKAIRLRPVKALQK